MSRFRRLRQTQALREMLQETHLSPLDLIQPFFVIEGKNKREPIESMPGIFRYSQDSLLKELGAFVKKGGKAILLFGVPNSKDFYARGAHLSTGIVQKCVRAIKKEFADMVVMTDVCLCAYTTHGHCGVVKGKSIDNDATIKILGKIALSHAYAGADVIAPSDMMDFRVRQIREDLDKGGFIDTAILSYSVKYQSSFYGPFREAAHSRPQFGDRATYQMNPGNACEALKEAKQDIVEGADMVMVKPALAYLDIVSMLRRELTVPIAAYSTSGEYAMVKAAAAKQWIDEKRVVLESLLSIKRAGADLIISYSASDVLGWIKYP